MTEIKLKRAELYKLVWSEPVHSLAKDYGLSDVGLAKICRRMGIPLPGRGYWAMLRSGKKLPVTLLPELRKGQVGEVTIRKRDNIPKDQKESLSEHELILEEKLPENLIEVAEESNRPHLLVQNTKRVLKSKRLDRYGRMHPYGDACLDVRVSAINLDRALRIMDALLKALERRGHIVSAKVREGTIVSVLDENIKIRIDEKLNRSERIPTKEEQKKIDSDVFFSFERYIYTPSGLLSLKIDDGYSSYLCISDGSKRRIEDSLNEFVVKLIKKALKEKETRAVREREHLEWEERRRQREEQERLRIEEEDRLKRLLKLVSDWQKARQIREFVSELKFSLARSAGEIKSETEIASWLTWAEKKADQLDATTNFDSFGHIFLKNEDELF